MQAPPEFSPTSIGELNQALWALVGGIRDILEGNFLAACLQGSLATGGFDEHSDVDFAITTKQPLSTGEVEALQKMHAQLFKLDNPWAQRLDGSYFPREVLYDYTQTGTPLWYLDNGHDYMVWSNHCNTVVVRWIIRERGVSLYGPPPASLVASFPTSLMQREIYDVMHDWGQEIQADQPKYNNRFYQSFIVLSYCRMLHDMLHGTINSKRIGADWAKANLDPAWHGLIDRTWAGRPDPSISVRTPADPVDFQRTLEFIRYIMKKSLQARQKLKF